jgi:hypothetical protein
MSTRKTTLFYAVLIAIASLAVGMVIASRLDLTPASSAQMVAMPAMNSTPLGGPIDATTFRNIAKAQIPTAAHSGSDRILRRAGGGRSVSSILWPAGARFSLAFAAPAASPPVATGTADRRSGHGLRHR